MERVILRGLLIFGLACLPFTFGNRHARERAIIFFATGYFVTFAAQIVVNGQNLKYSVRFLPKYFDTNILYEYLLLPLVSVWFNITTYRSKLPGIIGQALIYSGIHTVIESFLEKKTHLIAWNKWTWLHNVASLSIVCIGSRGVLTLFRWLSKRYDD